MAGVEPQSALAFQLSQLHLLFQDDMIHRHILNKVNHEMRVSLNIEGSREEIESLFGNLFSGQQGQELLAKAIAAGQVTANPQDVASTSETKIFDVLEDTSWSSFYLIHLVYCYGSDKQGGKSLSYEQLHAKGRFELRSISNRIGGVNKVAARLGSTPFLKIDVDKNTKAKSCFLAIDAFDGLEYALKQWDDDYRRWLQNDKTPYPGEQA